MSKPRSSSAAPPTRSVLASGCKRLTRRRQGPRRTLLSSPVSRRNEMSKRPSARSTAVVIGGSMAGLSAAAALATRFGSVVIVERDVVPDHPADRKGVPQGRHAHGLLPSGMIRLEGWFPGLIDELAAAGAPIIDVGRDALWHRTATGTGSTAGSEAPWLPGPVGVPRPPAHARPPQCHVAGRRRRCRAPHRRRPHAGQRSAPGRRHRPGCRPGRRRLRAAGPLAALARGVGL